MKMISNFTDTTIQTSQELFNQMESQVDSVYVDLENADDVIDGMQLLQHINQQFDLLYKENKKRKYLLKEVSAYLVRK
jgi:nitrate/nitrite-specific signal transduction histidine kinase